MHGTCRFVIFFFFNDTATTEIYTLSLHDALPSFDEANIGRFTNKIVEMSKNTQFIVIDRKSTRLNSSHTVSSYAVFCLKNKKGLPAGGQHHQGRGPARRLDGDDTAAVVPAVLVRDVFFFNDTATTEIYTLSLHDALPISDRNRAASPGLCRLAPRAGEAHRA